MNTLEILLNLLASPIRLPFALYDEYTTQNRVFSSNEQFIQEVINGNKIVLGGSWSAEQYANQFPNLPPEQVPEKSLSGFKIAVENLRIRNVRIGVYWNQNQFVLDGDVTIPADLDLLIKYSIQNNLKITLNLGPIKTFRYPEVYIPEFVLQAAGNIPVGYVVTLGSYISDQALAYLDKLINVLIQKYSFDSLNKVIDVIQLDNEPKNPFGPSQMTMGDDYMIATVDLVRKYFVNQKILLSGPLALVSPKAILDPDANKLFVVAQSIPNTYIGLNYYHYVPGAPAFPSINLYPDNFVALDPLYGKQILKQFQKLDRSSFQVSEAQMEPWGSTPPYNLPGNSITDLRFMIERNINLLKPFNDSLEEFIISLWGLEILVANIENNTLTEDQKQMIDLIQKINGLG